MGLFSAVTGGPANRATRSNEKQLWNNLTENFGFFDIGREAAIGHLQQGMDQAQGYLGKAGEAFVPLSALGTKYGGATTMLQNSLGLNGPQGNQAAVNAFQTSPGYQFQMEQGLQGLDRVNAVGGGNYQGKAQTDAIKYSQGLANQDYGDWRKNLSQFLSPELQATSGAATGQAAALGQQANTSMLGEGNMATLWQQDAINRANMNNMTTQGLTQNATQGANAQMAASGNALNLIGSGISALAGMPTGAGNLFGKVFG